MSKRYVFFRIRQANGVKSSIQAIKESGGIVIDYGTEDAMVYISDLDAAPKWLKQFIRVFVEPKQNEFLRKLHAVGI